MIVEEYQRVHARISLDAIKDNFNEIKRLINKDTKVMVYKTAATDKKYRNKDFLRNMS